MSHAMLSTVSLSLLHCRHQAEQLRGIRYTLLQLVCCCCLSLENGHVGHAPAVQVHKLFAAHLLLQRNLSGCRAASSSATQDEHTTPLQWAAGHWLLPL